VFREGAYVVSEDIRFKLIIRESEITVLLMLREARVSRVAK
jgi:hypothetical protein